MSSIQFYIHKLNTCTTAKNQIYRKDCGVDSTRAHYHTSSPRGTQHATASTARTTTPVRPGETTGPDPRNAQKAKGARGAAAHAAETYRTDAAGG